MVRRRRTKWSASATDFGKILFPNRIRLLTALVGVAFLAIIFRLFYVQILQGEYYTQKIHSQVSSETELSARRGDILVRDPNNNKLTKLALNTSFDELRIDAQETPDKQLVADILTPLVFGKEEYEQCQEDSIFCPEESVLFPEPKIDEETLQLIEFEPILPTFAEAVEKKHAEIYRKINTDNRYVLIKRQLSPAASSKIRELKRQYSNAHREDRQDLYAAKKSTDNAVPDYFKGVILKSNPMRYYPDQELASQVLGFVNHESQGQYGIEGKMHTLLAGKRGLAIGTTDPLRRIIGVSVEAFQKAVDGSDIVLTIDRIIQQEVEEILKNAVEKFKADSGQIIVMDPQTGFILAMANYPTFNPNEFGNVYLTRRTLPEDFEEERIFKTTPLFKKNPEEELIPATYDEYLEAWKLRFDPEFYVYENLAGPRAYLNKTIQEIYEPGSVWKPVVMAIALNENEVTPFTKYFEDKPIEVDVGGRLVPIRNADKKYLGWQTMTNVLERSANLGMVFVAKKLGKGVLYENLKNFNLGVETYIDLDEEQPGTLMYYTQWSTATLLNSAFGQGISATPLQVATAWCALANGGLLPEPQIINEIHHADGSIEETKPKFKNVLKADTAATITAMLISAVDNGVASPARINGYKIAGKTGTSQIADVNGRGYEDTSEQGTVITSFAGYAPAEDPKFVILVKFDRPRYGEDNTWGSTTAAPTFRQVTEFLLDYYDVPPEG